MYNVFDWFLCTKYCKGSFCLPRKVKVFIDISKKKVPFNIVSHDKSSGNKGPVNEVNDNPIKKYLKIETLSKIRNLFSILRENRKIR